MPQKEKAVKIADNISAVRVMLKLLAHSSVIPKSLYFFHIFRLFPVYVLYELLIHLGDSFTADDTLQRVPQEIFLLAICSLDFLTAEVYNRPLKYGYVFPHSTEDLLLRLHGVTI